MSYRDRSRDSRDRNRDRDRDGYRGDRYSSRSGGGSDQGFKLHATHARQQSAAYKNFFSQEPMNFPGVNYGCRPQDNEPPPPPARRPPPAPDGQAVPEPFSKVSLRDGRIEDRTKDWLCKCGERNFMRRRECWKCFGRRPADAGGEAGQQEWHSLCKQLGRGRRRGRSRSSESSSSSSSSSSKKKAKKKKTKSKSRSASGSVDCEETVNPEIEKAKHEALQQLLQLKKEPVESRMRQWRALLRSWHPDKHDNKEVATAVFQFLQKGKTLVLGD